MKNGSHRYRTNTPHLATAIMWIMFTQLVYAQESARQDTTLDPSYERMIDRLDFKNTDIKDVVRLLATKYQMNVIIDDDVKKKVTLHLVNVKLVEVVEFLVAEYSLRLERFGSIFKISNAPPPDPPKKRWNISYADDLITFEFKNDDLQEALAQISRVTGTTLLVEHGTSGTVSGLIIELPLHEALTQLMKSNGYYLRQEASTYTVGRRYMGAENKKGPSSGFWINTHGNLIDIEVNNAQLSSVLDELSRQTGFSFFLLGKPKGAVYARATNLELEECLNFILLDNDFTFKRSGNIYLIGDRSNKELITSRLIKLKHLKVDGVLEMLPQMATTASELKIVKEHNALLVNGDHEQISEIESIIKDIDHPIPQVFFEALVVDYTSFNDSEFSIEAGLGGFSASDSTRNGWDGWVPGVDAFWNATNANRYLGKIDNAFRGINVGTLPDDFYLRIRALESAGKANIRSKPQIATLNGHTAELRIGETRYFKLVSETPLRDPSQVFIQTSERFQTIDINISLKITPWVSSSGEITIEIQPEFNTPGDQISADVPPNIQSRALNSTVRLQDGETIVLGGLIQEIDSENVTRVPILGRIPLLGRLFSSRSKSKVKNELIIYVTPHLSYNEDWL